MRLYLHNFMKNLLLFFVFTIINFIAWNYFGILFLINIIILFYFIEYAKDKKWYYTCCIGFVLFLLLNVSATFWLIKVDKHYSLYAFLANSFLMLIPFESAVLISKKTKHFKIIFILHWVLWEWLLTNWDLSWPWLNFGNVLSNQWYLIGWYKVLGIYSGSIWILVVGYLLYLIFIKKNRKPYTFIIIALITLPLYSILSYNFTNKSSIGKKIKILTYCPVFNPKKRESNYLKTKHIYKYIVSHKAPEIILTPELFYEELYLNQLKNGDISFFYKKIFETKPKSVFFVGTEIDNSEKIKFNGMSVISCDTILFRTKKKYVPITEYTTPFLRPLFGDSYYSKNSIDDNIKIKKNTKTYPFVCYESLFSSFFAKNSTDTDFVFLSTSEAFLKKSDFAKKQYLNIIRIRAIETGRYVVKVSHDGTSCVISPKGEIIKYINNEFEIIEVPITNKNTSYQKIISRL
jgi:apolipoprotein N-acyltransferase